MKEMAGDKNKTLTEASMMEPEIQFRGHCDGPSLDPLAGTDEVPLTRDKARGIVHSTHCSKLPEVTGGSRKDGTVMNGPASIKLMMPMNKS